MSCVVWVIARSKIHTAFVEINKTSIPFWPAANGLSREGSPFILASRSRIAEECILNGTNID